MTSVTGEDGGRVAETCANWHRYTFFPSRGSCQACGVQWQNCEVGGKYRCPHWTAHPTNTTSGSKDNG